MVGVDQLIQNDVFVGLMGGGAFLAGLVVGVLCRWRDEL
jgi:hypothetical protein